MTNETSERMSVLIATMSEGTVDEEASQLLAELVAAVREHQAAGELTLKLKVRPANKSGRVLSITPAVTFRPPRASLDQAIYFATSDGGLHRNDPTQLTLEQELARTREDHTNE